MIQEEVVVIALEGDHAIVAGQRQKSCGSCHQEGACSTLSFGAGFKEIRLRAENHIGARIGDRVILELSERHLLRASFLVYIVPVIALFVGGFFVRYLALRAGMPPGTAEGIGGAAGMLSLGMVLVLLKRWFRGLEGAGGGTPVIRAFAMGLKGNGAVETMVPLQFHPRRDDQ
ncbi:MAG: SoxR reducing system RseC family protein [Magnetococcales bacterium]|nr:SoxR reducing system RseC family protein [Magnetococcales bacterium]MBF0150821.1 SoxR reducing system RseC family protein [Magnetococcales bacterium]MBF0172343.1 SoxR reducing system RseC family protein [Magnetococcales bacterium]MBF0629671.1 SoxR reducing system RseC family protein [Magnetococcales bacterium]